MESCRLTFQRATFQLIVCLLLFLTGCQPRQTVTLALLGDLVLGRGVDPKPDSLAYLAPNLSAADLALANLESPLSDLLPEAEDGSYNLCAWADRADLLQAWGLDLLSIANNHSLDCAPDGIAQTQSALSQVGLIAITPEPVILKINGLQLAFLAFDDISAALDGNAAAQSIRAARATGALVVVSVHWGAEYQGGASDRQKSLAQEFTDAGASLILGHHPHVLQPAAWIETTQGKTLVLYSLGNALFDQGGLDDTRQSALVLVTLDADGVTGVRAVPFEIDVVQSRVFQPDAETAGKILDRLQIP